MLVERDERLFPGGLARAKASFKDLDYRGYFVQAGQIEPMRLFAASVLRNPADLTDLTAPLQQRQRFGGYICNLIFLPRDEPIEILRQMSKRLSEL